MTFSVSILRGSAAGSGLATCTSDPPTARTASRPSITSSGPSQDAVESTRSPAVKPLLIAELLAGGQHLVDRSAGQRRAGMALGDDLVAVYPHRGRVVGDTDRQVGRRTAERVQRQHRHLTGAGRVGVVEPVDGAQGDVRL